MTAHSLEGARQRRDAIRVAVESGGGRTLDGGMSAGDAWKEHVGRLEMNADNLAVMIKELLEKVDRLSDKIGRQADKVSSLAASVSALERRLKHVPSIWSMLLGQALTACMVAGLLIAAFDFGWTTSKGRAHTTQSVPAASDGTGGGGEKASPGGDGRGKPTIDKAN